MVPVPSARCRRRVVVDALDHASVAHVGHVTQTGTTRMTGRVRYKEAFTRGAASSVVDRVRRGGLAAAFDAD